MALRGLRSIANAIETDGKYHYAYPFKAILPSPVVVGRYIDISQSTGVPKFNAYVGDALTGTPLVGIGNNGIYAGNFINGSTKHLARMQAQFIGAVVPANLLLLDYLMFYPLIDGDSTDEQVMDNPNPIPRYSSGQVMLVATVAGAQNGSGVMVYRNQDGVQKTVSFNVLTPAQYTISTVVNLSSIDACPFIPLDSGDTGVSMIESISFTTTPGGFFVAVIVRPLEDIAVLELSIPAERQFPMQAGLCAEIKQGAYLNFIAKLGAVASAGFRSELIFINS
jgi:hypothetical protein